MLGYKGLCPLCFNDENCSEDVIDYCKLAELAVLKALWYCLPDPYRQ